MTIVNMTNKKQVSFKEDKYPPCDTCNKELNYMPWHYSEKDNRHLHSCNECWEDIKKRIYRGEQTE